MDQVGWKGITARTFIDAVEGKSELLDPESPGICTDSLGETTTMGWGSVQSEGAVKGPAPKKK
jgi:hypothetical protein